MISSVPDFGERVVGLQLLAARINDRFERRELGMNSDFDRVGILIRKLELIGRVDLRLELDRFDRRPFEPQNFRAIAAASALTP